MNMNNRTMAWRRHGCWVPIILIALIPVTAEAREARRPAVVGAYYFDGWTGKTSHITELLQTEFAGRKPVWGWKDDTIEIMQKQIDLCADHRIAFWSFCWYYPEGKNKATPLNNALELYLKAPNSQRLKLYLSIMPMAYARRFEQKVTETTERSALCFLRLPCCHARV